jgi:hypothetical protein
MLKCPFDVGVNADLKVIRLSKRKKTPGAYKIHALKPASLEAAWIKALRCRGLESGVFTGSPGSTLVDRLLARLSGVRCSL